MAGVRDALIVASYDYADSRLRQLRAPPHDAESLSEVLSDPEVGGFRVRQLLNEPSHAVNLAVEDFFADRTPADLLLLHFSCHGLKDEAGDLFFATLDTRLGRLGATAVAADFVNRRMNRTRSRRVVLFLDCCYAGAFARGMTSRGATALHLDESLGGRGRAVITASTAMEYAFESGGDLIDTLDVGPSVFTKALVEGLRTGEADADHDGLIGLDELYGYVYDLVRSETPNQTPSKWVLGVQGELFIARRSSPLTLPSSLPEGLREAIASPLTGVRTGAVNELHGLLVGRHVGVALAAHIALERLAQDDSRRVVTAAKAALSGTPKPGLPPRWGTAQGQPARTRSSDAATSEDATTAPPAEQPGASVGSAEAATHHRRRWLLNWSGQYRKPVMLVAGAGAAAAAFVVGFTIFGGDAGPITPLPVDELVIPKKSPTVERPDLEVVNAFTPGERPLIENGERPTISPDRKKILFMRKPDGSKLNVPFIMDANGRNERPFIRGGPPECQYTTRPAWSNSGTRVAMFCVNPQEQVLDAKIYLFSQDGEYNGQYVPASNPSTVGFLTWVGDEGIVYVGMSSQRQGWTSLWWLRTLHGSTPEEVSKGWKKGSYDLPDWSEKHGLLFQRKDDPEHYDESGHLGVWSMRKNQDPVEFTPGELRGTEVKNDVFRGAAWSPDEQELAFWWLPSLHEQRLSTVSFRDRDDPDRWNTPYTDEITGADEDPPQGKAQPAWGTL